MRYAIIVLALLGVLAAPRPAAAANTGNDLLAACEVSELACTMYPAGWLGAFYTLTTHKLRRKTIWA